MKPILFSGPMVRAIMRGDKTQTRRIVKLPGESSLFTFRGLVTDPEAVNPATGKLVRLKGLYAIFEDGNGNAAFYKSRIQPGDVLYVRETWCNVNKPGIAPEYYYHADTPDCEDYDPSEWKWRPSLHMPKDAARLFLQVNGVRVESLQAISEEDARAEGAGKAYPYTDNDGKTVYVEDKNATYKGGFSAIWDGLNDRRGFGWDTNPYTWAYNFERVEKPKGGETT